MPPEFVEREALGLVVQGAERLGLLQAVAEQPLVRELAAKLPAEISQAAPGLMENAGRLAGLERVPGVDTALLRSSEQLISNHPLLPKLTEMFPAAEQVEAGQLLREGFSPRGLTVLNEYLPHVTADARLPLLRAASESGNGSVYVLGRERSTEAVDAASDRLEQIASSTFDRQTANMFQRELRMGAQAPYSESLDRIVANAGSQNLTQQDGLALSELIHRSAKGEVALFPFDRSPVKAPLNPTGFMDSCVPSTDALLQNLKGLNTPSKILETIKKPPVPGEKVVTGNIPVDTQGRLLLTADHVELLSSDRSRWLGAHWGEAPTGEKSLQPTLLTVMEDSTVVGQNKYPHVFFKDYDPLKGTLPQTTSTSSIRRYYYDMGDGGADTIRSNWQAMFGKPMPD